MKTKQWAWWAGSAVFAFYAAGIYSACQPPSVAVTREEVRPLGEREATLRLVRMATAQVVEEGEQAPDHLFRRDAHAHAQGCVKATYRVESNLSEPLRHGILATPGREYKAWVRFSNGFEADDRAFDGRGMAIKVMNASSPTTELLDASRFPGTGTVARPPIADAIPSRSRGTLSLIADGSPLVEGIDYSVILPTGAITWITDQSKASVVTASYEGGRFNQDFLLINHPTFFIRSVEEYEKFFGYQRRGKMFLYFLNGSANPFRWHGHEAWIAARTVLQFVGNPLAVSYYSQAAYKLGPHNTKFATRPCQPFDTETPDEPGPRFRRAALREHLRAGDACFEFLVQRQDPSKQMPIEDPSIEWKEAPFEQVARVEIAEQLFDSPEQDDFCEQLSFSPDGGSPAHRPVGALNRVRRVVYDAVSKRRHHRNQKPRHEPRGWCLALDGKQCAEPGQDDGAGR